MSVDSALAAGRRAAEARMLSRATVRRKTGVMLTGTDGIEAAEWAVVYVGPCRIAGMARSQSPSRTLEIGGVEVQAAIRTAHFPHDANLRDGDLIDVTSGETAPSVWRIVESDAADQQTARRVPVIATEKPGEWS